MAVAMGSASGSGHSRGRWAKRPLEAEGTSAPEGPVLATKCSAWKCHTPLLLRAHWSEAVTWPDPHRDPGSALRGDWSGEWRHLGSRGYDTAAETSPQPPVPTPRTAALEL